MKLVREFIDFERGLSDRGIKSKLLGFRKGQILTSNKVDDEGLYRLWIYIGKNESPAYINAKYNIEAYPLGFFSKLEGLKHMHKIIGASNLMTNDSKMRILDDEELKMGKNYLNNTENIKYINELENYLNLKIFI